MRYFSLLDNMYEIEDWLRISVKRRGELFIFLAGLV